jgi:capsular polysaccharide biosynthesis protein
MVDADPDAVAGAFIPSLATDHLVNLWFVKDALRRRRWLWISLAIIGLLCGAGYHKVVPLKYAASSTLYVADPPAASEATVSGNDLALLQTSAVGERAIELLGEPQLNPMELLGKAPGVSVSANVITITIDGPSPSEAIRRVNAVASGFLSFRAQQYNAQIAAVDNGLSKQISGLDSQVSGLTNEINGSGPIPLGKTLTDLVSDRAQDTTNIISLQQTLQQNQLGALSVVKGSRVITPGATSHSSKIKVFAFDGASGLVAGLGLGLGLVLVEAFTTDRLRRREDIAAVLGAPVDLSVGRVRLPTGRTRPALLRLAKRPTPPIQAVVRYLRNLLPTVGSGQTLLLIAADNENVPAVIATALARRLISEGKTVVLADLTGHRVLARMFGVNSEGRHEVRIGDQEGAVLLVPPSASRLEDEAPTDPTAMQWSNADILLALATVDPAVGAWHLLRWASRAVVLVTAGHSTARQLNGTGELLRAASVRVTSSVLIGADLHDDSVGLSDSAESPLQQPVGTLRPSIPPNWT